MKGRIVSLHKWAGVEVECEVFNLFSGLIPQRGLSRMEAGRKRQGLVPDFRVREPGAEGGDQEQSVLAELKVICSCPTRYARNPRATEKAVDRRASTLPKEYLTHAQNIDQLYGEVPKGVVGPVQAKLQSFPTLRRWVFGAWGEASDDVHSMVDYLAEARMKYQRFLEGRWRSDKISEEAQIAMNKGQIRKKLSLEVVRSQARNLLDRLSGLGAGAAAAAKRRDWAEQEERRMARGRRAYKLCLSQGHPVRRSGQFLVSSE